MIFAIWQNSFSFKPFIAITLTSSVFLAISCAPVDSKTKDSKAPAGGPFEGYSVVFSLTPAATQPGTTPTAPPPQTNKSNTNSGLNLTGNTTTTPGSQPTSTAALVPLKYCFEMPAGSTLDKATNKYNCNFFEYILSGSTWQMKMHVWDSAPNRKGIPAVCTFGLDPKAQILDCKYKVLTDGKETQLPCSSYEKHLTSNGNFDDFIKINSTIAGFSIEIPAQSGNSDAGNPLPTASNAGIIKGSCADGAGAAFDFPIPNESQLVGLSDAPTTQPPSNNQTTTQQTGAAASGTVQFKLSTRNGNKDTVIKKSSDKRKETKENDTSVQCVVTEADAVAVAKLLPGKNSADLTKNMEKKHYVVGSLISVTSQSKELCKNFISTTTSSKANVYLFSDHWEITK